MTDRERPNIVITGNQLSGSAISVGGDAVVISGPDPDAGDALPRSPFRPPSIDHGALAPVIENAAQLRGDEGTLAYDVFVAHASDDKATVARPLASALRDAGLDVWYDEFALGFGESIRRGIDQGIAESRFGVIVLSKAFFARGWSSYELDGLVSRAANGQQVILPVWHGVTAEDVTRYSAPLAGRIARDTSKQSVASIANEVAAVVLRHRRQGQGRADT